MDQEAARVSGPVLHESVGVLRYTHTPGHSHKLILACDQAIMDYYRGLLPPWKKANPQRYTAHVSVVRHELPVNLAEWGRHEGEEVPFKYTGQVFFGRVYCWLNVFVRGSKRSDWNSGCPDHRGRVSAGH